MTHGPGVKNASRRAERFWPNDRRHKQSLSAVYTASTVYMLGYQQIHQLVSVDFFKKRSFSGFPETQVCLRCSGMQVGGASLQAWPEFFFFFFFPLKPHKMLSHHVSVPHSHRRVTSFHPIPSCLCTSAHSWRRCPQAHLGTPALARFQPVETARGGAEGRSRQ